MDETEIIGCKYVNILVGLITRPEKTLLFECRPISSSANSNIILQVVDDAIKLLNIARVNFNLLLSDAASYMVSAGRTLHQLYPHLFHITCVAHLIHNCAMKVRGHYEEVDKLIARVKNAVVKNKTRSKDFVNISQPPDTIITRWASWLNAALYYSSNLPEVKRIIKNWTGQGILVTQAKNIVENPNIVGFLMEIERCYSCLTNIIFKFENASCGILKAYNSMNELDFGDDPCDISGYIKKRLQKSEILDIVNANRPEISPHLYTLLMNCQCTSSSVERSFSMLKKLLTKQRNFKDENIRKYIILYYNASVSMENSTNVL